jgi:hypothetical protein
MSRLDDLIELIQTTNEVYFITAPGRVRTAYILVDDIAELALKTYLQEQTFQQREKCTADLTSIGLTVTTSQRNVLRRYFEEELEFNDLCNTLNIRVAKDKIALKTRMSAFGDLKHWSANKSEAHKTYDDVINDVKNFLTSANTPLDAKIWSLLDGALERHKSRNRFYHDHQQSGLTINDDKCLHALCDLFELMEQLFPDFIDTVKLNKVIRCQIGVLRLKLAAHGNDELKEPYYKALDQSRTTRDGREVNRWADNYEHTIVHTVTEEFFIALTEQLINAIYLLNKRVIEIDNMVHTNLKQTTERRVKVRLLTILTRQLEEIKDLVSAP